MNKTKVIKKIMTVLLIGCMVLCMAACGGNDKSTESPKTYSISYSVEGEGMTAHAQKGSDINFSTSVNGGIINGLDGVAYVIEAREKDGSSAKFVKWTNNGKDYSDNRTITVKASEEMKLVAVFK